MICDKCGTIAPTTTIDNFDLCAYCKCQLKYHMLRKANERSGSAIMPKPQPFNIAGNKIFFYYDTPDHNTPAVSEKMEAING